MTYYLVLSSQLNYFYPYLFSQFLSKEIWSFAISVSLEGTTPLYPYFPCFSLIKEKAFYFFPILVHIPVSFSFQFQYIFHFPKWGWQVQHCSCIVQAIFRFLFLASLSFLQLVVIGRKLAYNRLQACSLRDIPCAMNP